MAAALGKINSLIKMWCKKKKKIKEMGMAKCALEHICSYKPGVLATGTAISSCDAEVLRVSGYKCAYKLFNQKNSK